MSLWGNKDLVYNAGTIAVNLTSKTATGVVGVVTFTLGNQVDVKNAKLGNSNAFTSDYTFGDLL